MVQSQDGARAGRRRSVRAIVAVVVAALLGTLLVAGVVDTVLVSRREAALSGRIRPATAGVPLPAVTLGGAPGAALLGSDRVDGGTRHPSLTVRAEGVSRPGLGLVTVTLHAHQVVVPDDPGAPLTVAPGTEIAVELNGDVLGRALGLEDARVGGEDDSSLAGGAENRARVSGRLPSTRSAPDPGSGDGRIAVLVDLVPAGPGRPAALVPTSADTGPAGQRGQDVAEAMRVGSLRLAPDVLPLGATVESMTVHAGTVTARGHVDRTTVLPSEVLQPY